MILRPVQAKPEPPSPFALETVTRLPLAEGFYLLWAHVAPDDFLQTLFQQHRGRCYEDVLTFSEIILVLAEAITRYHGSGNRAITKAIQRQQLSVQARAVYGKLSRLPLALAEALLSALTARLRPLFPSGLFRSDIPASLRTLNLVVLDGKKIKRVAKRLLATRGRPGKLFGGKILVAYSPADGLAVALAADPDGAANDIRLMPRVMVLAREAVAGPRLWIADRHFCDLDQPERFTQEQDHYLVRFSKKCSFEADPQRPAQQGLNEKGQAVVQEWGWMGSSKDPRRCYVRRITLVRPGDEDVAVVTDLLDEQLYPAVDLLRAYLMRWQIEKVFQEITEVFELRHLIGTAPQATVLQASLCLVIYNLIQVLRGYAALAATQKEEKEARTKPEVTGVEGLSSEKIFADLHEELISLHRLLQQKELLACLPRAVPPEELRRRLGVLLERAWSPDWKKARNKKPRPAKPHAKESGAHTSVHKLLLEAREAANRAKLKIESP
jgi:DDE family transposase